MPQPRVDARLVAGPWFDDRKAPVVAWNKKDMTPSKVLLEHSFELGDYYPI